MCLKAIGGPTADDNADFNYGRTIMSNTEHRLGVCEIHLVERHLKLEPCETEAIESAVAEIDGLFGLDCVSFDATSRVITLAYDATRLGLDNIEKVLDKHGVDIGHGWWTHFKENFYGFVDQNMKENAVHEPWSCHQNPPTARR